MKIPYYKEYGGCGYSLSRLKPTGRCKIVEQGDSDKTRKYVQHQGLIFKSWILVDRIQWVDHKEEHEFDVHPVNEETLAQGFKQAEAQCLKSRAAKDADKDYDI